MSLTDKARDAILTERKAIEHELEWIREERRNLSNRYYELLKRLRELDERDIEALDPNTVMSQLIETTQMLTKLMPQLSMHELVDHLKREHKVEERITEHVEEAPPISRKSILESKLKEPIKAIKTKSNRNNFEAQAPLIAKVLKDSGRPMRLNEIADKMFEVYNINWVNPTNALTKVQKHESRVEKVSHGTYQYKFN